MNNDRINEIRARCEAAESFGLETLDERTKNLTVGLLGMHENGTMQVSKNFLHTIRAYMVELLECRRDEIPALLAEIDRLTERWIPVTERLPQDGQDVWIHEAGWVYRIKWGFDKGFKPSHWMQYVVPAAPDHVPAATKMIGDQP